MLREYGKIYSSDEIMAKRLCFSSAMVTFSPLTVICSMNAPKNRPISISVFNETQLVEIEEYLKSYTEKPYVIEAGGELYVIIPSVYPTSTMCLLLRIEQQPSAFLRFTREKSELFVLSDAINIAPARMTKRLESARKDFLELCRDVEDAFLYLERFNLSFDDADVLNGYYEQVIALSRFFAVPIDKITLNDSNDGVPIQSNFALFTAFCSTMMMLARNDAIDRHISVELNFFGGSLTVNISFKTEKKLKITNETFLWDYLASDKRMLFEYYSDEERFNVSFQPRFIDWSYLGIKQINNAEMFFEEEKS